MKTLKLIVALILISGLAKAQSDLTLQFMNDVFQSSYMNPSVTPEHKISVGLPTNVSVQVINTGFIFSDFVKFNSDTSAQLNLNDFYDGLKKTNMLYVGENMDLFHVRVKVQNAFYWFSVRQNFNSSFFYSKDMLSLVMEGTKPFVGGSMDFSDIRLKSEAYLEYSLGMSINIKKWTFGTRFSLLKGIANADFNPDKFLLQIEDETYANTAVADAEFRTSGIPKDSKGDIGIDDFNYDWVKDNVLAKKNNGFALSAGATYKFDERLSASFSFYDLGFINWKEDLETYTVKGQFDLKGVDAITQFLNDGGMNFDTLFNGFEDAFDVDTIVGSSYRTWLSPKFNLAASYKLASRTNVYGMLHATYNTNLYPTFTVGISQGLGRFFLLTANLSFAYRTIKNFGVGLVLKPGPLQFFVAVDNYYPLLGNEQLLSFTNMNARIGVNLVFGRVSKPDGMPLW